MATKQPLYVNGKIFNSMNKAAKFLRISVSTLADRLRNKEATVYKDIFIEKAKKQPKYVFPKKERTTNRNIPILVDGVAYKTCAEAERSLGFPTNVLAGALKVGQKEYKKHKIEYVCPSDKEKIKRISKNNVGVQNITENIYFNSIRKAAEYAGVDDWSMSKKMETVGSFVDNKGNVYKRLKPMESKNKYKMGKKPTINHPTQRFFPTFDELVPVNHKIPVEPVKEKKDTVPQIVKDAINEKIILMLKEKGLYEDIVNLLNYGGFSTIKITD